MNWTSREYPFKDNSVSLTKNQGGLKFCSATFLKSNANEHAPVSDVCVGLTWNAVHPAVEVVVNVGLTLTPIPTPLEFVNVVHAAISASTASMRVWRLILFSGFRWGISSGQDKSWTPMRPLCVVSISISVQE